MGSTTVTKAQDLSPYGLPLLASGKVREIYSLSPNSLLFVASDRVSAYDVILARGIPHKGALLTRLSKFWFDLLQARIPSLQTHFLALGIPESLAQQLPAEVAEQLKDRSMQVRKLEVIMIESIVRGYISGSAWSSYKKTGKVNGEKLPEGLRESEKLPEPIWTPSTKAEQGEHDENISRERAAELVTPEVSTQISTLSLNLYTVASAYALTRGIIIADTKFEFGLDRTTSPPTVILIDEVLTPDSSRFWRADDYEVGRSQKSLDKQFLRDWLVRERKDGVEGVVVPESVVEETRRGYDEAFKRLTGDHA